MVIRLGVVLVMLFALAAPAAAAPPPDHELTPRVLTGEGAALRACLSPRENQVCDLLLLGCSSDAIALRLGISRHTVKDHRKQIFRKLGIASLAELFASVH